MSYTHDGARVAALENTSGFMPGMEINDQHGNRYVIVGVHAKYIGLKRSTWWRRLWWRVKGWFTR